MTRTADLLRVDHNASAPARPPAAPPRRRADSGTVWLGLGVFLVAYWLLVLQGTLQPRSFYPLDWWLSAVPLGLTALLTLAHALNLRRPRQIMSALITLTSVTMAVRLTYTLLGVPSGSRILSEVALSLVWAALLPVLAGSVRVSALARWLTRLLPATFSGLSLLFLLSGAARTLSPRVWLSLVTLNVLSWGLLLIMERLAHHARRLTHYRRRARKLRRLAFFDDLTGLNNRAYLDDHLRGVLQPGSQVAVMFMDLDGFKSINDTLGHASGDEVLRLVAERLRAAAPGASCVARVGGDEFVVVQPYDHRAEVGEVGQRLVQELGEPIVLREHLLRLSVSMGVSLYPQDGADGPDLLRRADVAMYNVKRGGKNALRFYGGELHTLDERRQVLERELRGAQERGELHLLFQPVCSLESGQRLGFESLLRWEHPELGEVSPGTLIPVAEGAGLIGGVGEWVLTGALGALRGWHDAGFRELKVAVNVSPLQLMQPRFAEFVQERLSAFGLPPGALELEITEGVDLRDKAQIVQTLQRLREAGVLLSLDDFGMGFASLAHLNELPVQVVKIDQSFVADLLPGEAEAGGPRTRYVRSLIAAMVSVAGTLGLKVVAEGVETAEQAEELTRLGCHAGQGYYFQRPMPEPEVLKLLRGETA